MECLLDGRVGCLGSIEYLLGGVGRVHIGEIGGGFMVGVDGVFCGGEYRGLREVEGGIPIEGDVKCLKEGKMKWFLEGTCSAKGSM